MTNRPNILRRWSNSIGKSCTSWVKKPKVRVTQLQTERIGEIRVLNWLSSKFSFRIIGISAEWCRAFLCVGYSNFPRTRVNPMTFKNFALFVSFRPHRALIPSYAGRMHLSISLYPCTAWSCSTSLRRSHILATVWYFTPMEGKITNAPLSR